MMNIDAYTISRTAIYIEQLIYYHYCYFNFSYSSSSLVGWKAELKYEDRKYCECIDGVDVGVSVDVHAMYDAYTFVSSSGPPLTPISKWWTL